MRVERLQERLGAFMPRATDGAVIEIVMFGSAVFEHLGLPTSLDADGAP